jgi:hypothetical protein
MYSIPENDVLGVKHCRDNQLEIFLQKPKMIDLKIDGLVKLKEENFQIIGLYSPLPSSRKGYQTQKIIVQKIE